MNLCLKTLALVLVLTAPGEAQRKPSRPIEGFTRPTPIGGITRPTKQPWPPGPCACMEWTKWINADTDPDNGGDFETIGYNLPGTQQPGTVTVALAQMGISCNTPIMAECRDAETKAVWHTVGDDTTFGTRINCDAASGITCENEKQADGQCHDYEIRLLCWQPCGKKVNWWNYFDKDNPSGSCDCEHPGWQDHPARHAPPCSDGKSPLEIECETLAGTPAAISDDLRVRCSLSGGFTCQKNDQPDSGPCSDYRVRYLCGDPSA